VAIDATAERDLLLDRLDGQRGHVLTQLEGLSDEQLRRPDEPAADVLGAYRAAIAHSDEIISARHLGDPPAQPEKWWDDAGLSFPDLRTIVVHVLVETSVHAGHLDAVRELLDGRQHLVI
jgi:hypothetical protein